MNIGPGTRICSLGGNAKGMIVRKLDDGTFEAETDAGATVRLSIRSFRVVKPKLTARDLVLLRDMRIGLGASCPTKP